MTSNFETLTLERDDRGVARLTFNRPDKHNALNDVMILDLRRAAAELAEDDEVRLVVLTGAGKSFCAGGDIQWFTRTLKKSRAGRMGEATELAHMLYDLNHLPKPLIGRVQGPAYGGGVCMISVCDVTIGTLGSRFGLTEVRLGLIAATISPYVVRRMGEANARATMLSGALFDAERALEIGLLSRLVAADELDDAVEAVIADHLEAAPGAVAETKRLIDYVATHAIADSMIYTADRISDAWESEEGGAGIDGFLNKRLPPWRSGA